MGHFINKKDRRIGTSFTPNSCILQFLIDLAVKVPLTNLYILLIVEHNLHSSNLVHPAIVTQQRTQQHVIFTPFFPYKLPNG